MKFCWRITKYNPLNRDLSGVYLKDEWTSYSEIEKKFNEILFSFDEYERIENLYINAIKLFMQCNHINALQVSTLEKNKKLAKDVHNTEKMINLFHMVKEGDWIEIDNMESFCKLILRDIIWCKLKYNRKMFVHFGWDFYIYIGSALACPEKIFNIEKNGLFVEPFKSPYQK